MKKYLLIPMFLFAALATANAGCGDCESHGHDEKKAECAKKCEKKSSKEKTAKGADCCPKEEKK